MLLIVSHLGLLYWFFVYVCVCVSLFCESDPVVALSRAEAEVELSGASCPLIKQKQMFVSHKKTDTNVKQHLHLNYIIYYP